MQNHVAESSVEFCINIIQQMRNESTTISGGAFID